MLQDEVCTSALRGQCLFLTLSKISKLEAKSQNRVESAYQTARELSEQSLTLAQQAHDPARLLGSHTALGMTVFYLGEFLTAQEHLEQGIALYAHLQHHPHAFRARPRCGLHVLCGLGPLGAWLSGPGSAEDSRDAHPGSGALTPL